MYPGGINYTAGLFNNAGASAILIAEKKNGKIRVINEHLYKSIVEGAGLI
jgi:hypothetical protein